MAKKMSNADRTARAYTGLLRGRVCLIDFECTTPGPEVETGNLEGYWTGEVDTWGKFTIKDVNGGPTLYLFPREIVGVEPI